MNELILMSQFVISSFFPEGLLDFVYGEALIGDDFFRVDVDLEKAGLLRAVVVGGGGFEGQDVAVQGAGVADVRGVVVDDFDIPFWHIKCLSWRYCMRGIVLVAGQNLDGRKVVDEVAGY